MISANSLCCLRCIRRLSRAFPSPDSAFASRLSASVGDSSSIMTTAALEEMTRSSASVSMARSGPASSSGWIINSIESSPSLTISVATSTFCSSFRARRIETTMVTKKSIITSPTAPRMVSFICWEPGNGASRASSNELSSMIGRSSPEREANVRNLREPEAVESITMPSDSIPAYPSKKPRAIKSDIPEMAS